MLKKRKGKEKKICSAWISKEFKIKLNETNIRSAIFIWRNTDRKK